MYSDFKARTWESELEALDLIDVVIEREQIKGDTIFVEVDERYSVLPGKFGPRLYCTTCRRFTSRHDMRKSLLELVNEAHEHEKLCHYSSHHKHRF